MSKNFFKKRGENGGGDIVRRQGIAISKSQHQTKEVKTNLSKTIQLSFKPLLLLLAVWLIDWLALTIFINEKFLK